MKRQLSLVLSFLLLTTLGMTSCKKTDPAADYNAGRFDLTSENEMLEGTASVTKKGVLFDSSSRTPSITVSNGFKVDIMKKGKAVFEVKNDTEITKATVSFITEEDPDWTSFKSFEVPLTKSEDYEQVTVDLSATYGWTGMLTGLKITTDTVESGELYFKSITLNDGGDHYIDNIEISQAEVIHGVRDRMSMGISMGPDGVLGSWYDSEGKLHFVGQASGGPFITTGTPDKPFTKLEASKIRGENVDWNEYNYYSVAQIVKDPNSDLLVGITHLERHWKNTTGENNGNGYVATIGLSISRNNGRDWKFLGEFISQNVPIENREFNRDIGNGTIFKDDKYLYIFCNDVRKGTNEGGISVSRVLLTELFEYCGREERPPVFKYKDGKWEEPGWGGDFSNVLPEGVHPNFFYITYNKPLNKYFMVICQSPYYTSNDGDMMLLASDSFLDWSNAQKQYIGCSKSGEQYPTFISMEEDPQLTSGDTFYVYYCRWDAFDENGVSDWQRLWGTADYVRQTITVKK